MHVLDDVGIAVALTLGVLASSCLHLSQGMMRLGIQRLKADRTDRLARRLYISGLLLNFTAPLWVMVANLFAPTVWFTSMFATGLITLLIFSHCFLDDPLTRRKSLGAVAILLATILLAFGGLADMAEHSISLVLLLTCSVVWLVATPLLALWMKRVSIGAQEAYFGIAAGGFFALDALWKSQAQTGAEGVVSFLPSEPIGWLILAASFAGAGGAFLMMQWSYLRHCRATAVVVSYNVVYVLLPLSLLTVIAWPLQLNGLVLVALFSLLVGAVLTQRHQPRI